MILSCAIALFLVACVVAWLLHGILRAIESGNAERQRNAEAVAVSQSHILEILSQIRDNTRVGASAAPLTNESYSHHIYGCQFIDGEWKEVEEIRNGMHTHEGREHVKWFLSQGAEYGVRWNNGGIEAGQPPTEPMLAGD